jgi:glycine/D-amino acid oxidase-like deaminating enzyme
VSRPPHRRAAVGLLAATALAPLAARAQPTARPSVCVIGAGILGCSIAYHLARAGAAVTVLERTAPGAGATQGAFAMLIATHEDDAAFNALYGMAVLDWRRLELELGGAPRLQWGGTVTWAAPGPKADELAATTRRLQGWGAPIRPIDAAELARLVPGVAPGPWGAGNFSPDQGTLDPMQALSAITAAARRAGVAFRYPCEVKALRRDAGDRIVAAETAAGPVAADVFVLAAGAATPDLTAALGVKVPIDVVSGSLAHSAPHRPVLGRVLNGPAGSLKQDPDGRIVFGPDYRPGANGKDVSRAYGEQLLAEAARVMPALAGARLETMTVGYVPIPKDSHPIAGFCAAPANLYLALTMSGVTMAPLMGRFAASEITGGVTVDVLAPYRPARFG